MRNQKGFTLIEIIAVLVILGILAAVAIPKYMGLQDEARLKAVDGAISEGKARVNMYAARTLLANNGVLITSALNNTNLQTDAGDFVLNFSATDTAVNITAQGAAGGPIPTSISKAGVVNLPTGTGM